MRGEFRESNEGAISRRRFLGRGAIALGAITGLEFARNSEPARAALGDSLLTSLELEPLSVDMICREAWGARKPQGKFVRHRVQRLTVHHSAAVLLNNRRAPQRFREHQALHQQVRGWPDIAYHILIDRHGNVYAGRPLWSKGDTATDYDPTGHLLVLCEGNFDEQRIPDRQVAALVRILAWAARHFDVSPATIRGHRDYARTACPGRNLYALVRSGVLHRRVERRIALADLELVKLCGSAGRQRIREIENGLD